MRGAERITTYVDRALGQELDQLCLERRVAKSRVIAEAIREYISARRGRSGASLAAQLPRHEGRPSRSETEEARRREAALAKSSGRPLRSISVRASIDNSAGTVQAAEAPDAA